MNSHLHRTSPKPSPQSRRQRAAALLGPRSRTVQLSTAQVLLIGLLSLLAGYKHVGDFIWVEELSAGQEAPSGEYLIAPGDAISVRVFQQDNLSARVRVRSDGKV